MNRIETLIINNEEYALADRRLEGVEEALDGIIRLQNALIGGDVQ